MQSEDLSRPASGVGAAGTKTNNNARRWLAIYVDMLDHEVVGANIKAPKPADPNRHAWQPFVLWNLLLKEAAWKDRERVIGGRALALKRGQLAVSYRYLAREANWGVKAIRLFLARLERFGMVSVEGTDLTVITICNYAAFQAGPERKGTARAQDGHGKGTVGAQDTTRDTRDTRATTPPDDAGVLSGLSAKQDHSALSEDSGAESGPCPRRQIAPLELQRQLVEAAGGALASEAIAPGLASMATPLWWLAEGCDLERDVLVAIRDVARRSRARPITTWEYFTKPIVEAKARRERPLSEVEPRKASSRVRPVFDRPGMDRMNAELAVEFGIAAEGG